MNDTAATPPGRRRCRAPGRRPAARRAPRHTARPERTRVRLTVTGRPMNAEWNRRTPVRPDRSREGAST
jgi:hypothetical protein